MNRKKSNKSGDKHNALMAAALQDHLLRSVNPNESPTKTFKAPSYLLPSKNNSARYSQFSNKKSNIQEEIVITENSPQPTLAQKLGVFEGPKPILSEDEWKSVKEQAIFRGSFNDVCPICQDVLGCRQEVLLSCSHTFHRQCLASLERFSGKRVCPVCRQQAYEARVVYEAGQLYKVTCAKKIQAAWRGYLARVEYKRLRKIHPPKDIRLRKRFFEDKLSEITDKFIASDVPDVDSFLRDLDRSMERARQVYKQFEDKDGKNNRRKLTIPAHWEELIEMALNREDDTCPICLGNLGLSTKMSMDLGESRPIMLLSCSHLFHSSCLDSFEHFTNHSVTGNAAEASYFCPLCRTSDYEKICLQTLFSTEA